MHISVEIIIPILMLYLSLSDFSREEYNEIEEQRALATIGRTYFVKAESYADDENENKKKSLELSRKYYLKSLNICEK